MYVVMLDIDGVLNNNYTKERCRRDKALVMGLDPINVEVFNEFMVKATALIGEQPLIVVSSAWRIGITTEFLEQVLRKFGVAYPVHDVTPNIYRHFSDTPGNSRAHQIEGWLKEQTSPVKGLVILDDLAISGPLRKYQVQTDAYVGFLQRHGVKAARILKEGFDASCLEQAVPRT